MLKIYEKYIEVVGFQSRHGKALPSADMFKYHDGIRVDTVTKPENAYKSVRIRIHYFERIKPPASGRWITKAILQMFLSNAQM